MHLHRLDAIHQVICAQWDDHEGLANLNVYAELYGNLLATPSFCHPFDRKETLAVPQNIYTGVFLFRGRISV